MRLADDPPRVLLLLLASQPRRDAAFKPLNQTHEDDAHGGNDDDWHEHAVDPEDVAVLDDEITEPDEADEELRDDHADETAADRETDPGEHEGRRGGQDHIGPESPLAGVERPSHFQESAIDVPHSLLRVDEDRKNAKQRDRRHAWRIALEFENETDERDERDRRQRAKGADERMQGVDGGPPTSGHDPEEHADDNGDHEPSDEGTEARHERRLQLARLDQLHERDGDRRRRPDDQRAPAGSEELPHQP